MWATEFENLYKNHYIQGFDDLGFVWIEELDKFVNKKLKENFQCI